MGEEVGDDAALRVDFLFKEPQQFPPLPPGRQRTRPPRLGEDEEHAQALVLPRASACVAGAAMSWTTRTRRLRSPSVGWFAAGRAISHGTRASAAARWFSSSAAPGNWMRSVRWDSDAQSLPKISFAQHFLGDAHADLGDARRFLALLHVVAQVVPQVEQALLVGDGDGLEIRLPVGELRAMGVEQAEFSGVSRVIGGDDEVEVGRHGRRRFSRAPGWRRAWPDYNRIGMDRPANMGRHAASPRAFRPRADTECRA